MNEAWMVRGRVWTGQVVRFFVAGSEEEAEAIAAFWRKDPFIICEETGMKRVLTSVEVKHQKILDDWSPS